MAEAEQFAERVIKIEQPDHHYTLLMDPDGRYHGIGEGGGAEALDCVDDRAIWDEDADRGYRHVATGAVREALGDLTPRHGPAQLPSEYLEFFRANGWVCLASVLDHETVDGLQRVACTDAYAADRFDRTRQALSQHPAVARTVAEPLSLWLIRQYMQTEEITLAHSPGMAVLTQDDGERRVQGWHSDYPYHWGVPAHGLVPTPTGATVLGVQRNVCVSEFTKVGGATAFKLGSHARDEGPPEAWGNAAAHAREGYRAAHGLPYSGPDADVVEAPAGSIILYDSRTWHRAGINRTPKKRAAMLQAMVPMYVMPKNDTSAAYKEFIASEACGQITARERREIEQLMVRRFIGPGGRYAIGPDEGLTEMVAEHAGGGGY